MGYNEFKEVFSYYLNKIDVELNENQFNSFYKYMNLLIEWNEKMNLTAIIEPKDIILKHFVDSLTVSKYIKEDASVVDVGTGAGFPGIPLRIYRDDISICLVDSLNKRLIFLKEVIDKLNLKNINLVHSRAEEFGKNKKYRESFDVSTSRAVANLSTLSEYLLPLVKIGGNVICMKGSNLDEEAKLAKNAINILGGKVKLREEFDLADTDNKRNILIIEKVNKTPGKFPRKPGLPSKEPLN